VRRLNRNFIVATATDKALALAGASENVLFIKLSSLGIIIVYMLNTACYNNKCFWQIIFICFRL